MLNNSTNHQTTKVTERLKECQTSLSMIPSDLTSKLYSSDIGFNTVFKESLINKCKITALKIIMLSFKKHNYKMSR